MIRISRIASRALLLAVLSTCALAQDFVTTPPPQNPPAAAAAGSTAAGLSITPLHGQTQEQQWSDRYACHGWASSQSGYDPVHPGTNPAGLENYRRALSACLEGRGYGVSAGPPSPPPAPPVYRTYPAYPAYPPPVYVRHYAAPEVEYRPFSFGFDFGFSPTTGASSDYLDWGANIGFAFTWTPSATVPVGLRVDPTYSWFHVHPVALNYSGSSYFAGYQDVYGTDLDLQVNLGRYWHWPGNQFYLLGGAGWYKVYNDLHQVAYIGPGYCVPYYCAPGYPVITGYVHSTSSWRDSWNIGLGWDMALDSHTSFFVEARYQSIYTGAGSHLELVPVRFGIRF